MMNKRFFIVEKFTHWVSALCSGLYAFSGALRRYETGQGQTIAGVSCFVLYLKKRTSYCIQLRFLG